MNKQQALEKIRKLRAFIGELDKPKYIIDRVKTWEDIISVVKENGYDIPILYSGSARDEQAYKKLKLISRVLNEGWTPDWEDSYQKKWWPYFKLSSGFGFSGSGYSYANSSTSVGSRLCFRTQELSDYAAQQFSEVYKDFLT